MDLLDVRYYFFQASWSVAAVDVVGDDDDDDGDSPKG